MHKLYILAFSIFSLFLLSACEPSTPATEGTISTVSNNGSAFAIAEDPIRVTPTLDTSNQSEAIIPVSGGSLITTAADGTLFRLDIPANALVADTLIRMTPVSQLDGMPFGSNPLAVQLEPEGMQFYAPVILTITPAQEIPINQQLFFTYQGMGENLALALPVVDSPEIKLELQHFSGYGVTKGFLADIEPVRARIGGTAVARLQSAVAEELGRARQRALLGVEDDTPLDLTSYFQQYDEQVIQPRHAAAGESCAAGRLAIQTALGYERQRQLLGIEGDANVFDSGLMDTVANICIQEEFELCRDEHIIHAEGWRIFGDECFAKKEWIHEDAGLGLSEAGTFKLYHKPQAGQ